MKVIFEKNRTKEFPLVSLVEWDVSISGNSGVTGIRRRVFDLLVLCSDTVSDGHIGVTLVTSVHVGLGS